MTKKTTGRFCKPLCEKQEILFKECRVHHSNTFVIKARWKDTNIVLKRKNKQGRNDNGKIISYMFVYVCLHDICFLDPSFEFHRVLSGFYLNIIAGLTNDHSNKIEISERIALMLGIASPYQDLSRKFKLLDQVSSKLKNDLQNGDETQELISQKEFIFLSIFENISHISHLYGSCGAMYAVEYAMPLSNFFPKYVPRSLLRKDIDMALSFLSLLNEFKKAPFGPLSICDMKTSDFGVREDNSIIVIDYDMIFIKNVLDNFMSQPDCERNEDCDFFDCKSQCDLKRRKCTSNMSTNNLQVSDD